MLRKQQKISANLVLKLIKIKKKNTLKISLKKTKKEITIAAKINRKIISTSFAFRNTLKEPTENTVSLTTVSKVESAIKELQDKKATGPNSISSKILKNNKIFSLSHFVTQSVLFLCQEIFLSNLKLLKLSQFIKKEILWMHKLLP